jgi:hypothetical protein
MRVRALPLYLVCCVAACRERDAPVPPRATVAAPVVSASAPAASEIRPEEMLRDEAKGLRVRSGTFSARPSWGFSELSLDLSQLRLEIASTGRGEQLAKLLPARGLAVINGGYFETDFRPSTWLVRHGVELGKKSDTSKGGLLAIKAKQLYLGPFSGLTFEPELAVQSFPLIIEADGKSGIHRDDGRRAARTVVCQTSSELNFVVIAAPRGDGPTLFETAALLQKPWPAGFGCRTALNLDGGPSSGVWFAPGIGAKQRPPAAPVAYGIALVPR